MINLTNKVRGLKIADEVIKPGDGSCTWGCC